MLHQRDNDQMMAPCDSQAEEQSGSFKFHHIEGAQVYKKRKYQRAADKQKKSKVPTTSSTSRSKRRPRKNAQQPEMQTKGISKTSTCTSHLSCTPAAVTRVLISQSSTPSATPTILVSSATSAEEYTSPRSWETASLRIQQGPSTAPSAPSITSHFQLPSHSSSYVPNYQDYITTSQAPVQFSQPQLYYSQEDLEHIARIVAACYQGVNATPQTSMWQ